MAKVYKIRKLLCAERVWSLKAVDKVFATNRYDFFWQYRSSYGTRDALKEQKRILTSIST